MLTVASSFPQGTKEWEYGLANHTGARSVAVDASGIYVGAGISENVTNAPKMNWAGTQWIWSAGHPQAWMGRFAMASMNGNLHWLQQNCYVATHGTNSPNTMHQSVGVPGAPWNTGYRWDALWPGDTRPGSESWSGAENPMDMAAHDTGSNPQLVLSYRDHDAVQWRDPQSGAVLDSAAVNDPEGVALDNAGNLLVVSGTSVVRLSRANKTPATVVSGLTDPYRIDVDRSTGEILVIEHGTSQRVKRFSPTGQLLNTYGRLGGRQYGLYVAADFKDVVDIASDNQGGFLVAERSAPRRVARFGHDGALIKEWYGGTHWVAQAGADPDDPRVMWIGDVQDYEVMRVVADYQNKTWRVHSVYNPGALLMINHSFKGGGYDQWHVRKYNGTTYLVRRGQLYVIKVNEADWSIKAAAAATFSDGNAKQAYLWTDANGDGQPQETEYRRYAWGLWGGTGSRWTPRAPASTTTATTSRTGGSTGTH